MLSNDSLDKVKNYTGNDQIGSNEYEIDRSKLISKIKGDNQINISIQGGKNVKANTNIRSTAI